MVLSPQLTQFLACDLTSSWWIYVLLTSIPHFILCLRLKVSKSLSTIDSVSWPTISPQAGVAYLNIYMQLPQLTQIFCLLMFNVVHLHNWVIDSVSGRPESHPRLPEIELIVTHLNPYIIIIVTAQINVVQFLALQTAQRC